MTHEEKGLRGRKLKILVEWDVGLSAVAALALWLWGPPTVPNTFALDLYSLGTSITAVVFSVYIAALAIIMSAGNDDFVQFLAEKRSFEVILFGFKFTLMLLFVALTLSAFLYGLTSWWKASGDLKQPTLLVAVFVFFLAWSLFATLTAALAAVKHSQLHIKFFRFLRGENRND